MAKITIDFFELAFLAESCIPPSPIARASFWDRLINEIYNELSKSERERLFNWLIGNSLFDLENKDWQLFYARFNPKNQFLVTCFFGGNEFKIECFKQDEEYFTSKTQSILSEYITCIDQI